jgi:hypothetical protein
MHNYIYLKKKDTQVHKPFKVELHRPYENEMHSYKYHGNKIHSYIYLTRRTRIATKNIPINSTAKQTWQKKGALLRKLYGDKTHTYAYPMVTSCTPTKTLWNAESWIAKRSEAVWKQMLINAKLRTGERGQKQSRMGEVH